MAANVPPSAVLPPAVIGIAAVNVVVGGALPDAPPNTCRPGQMNEKFDRAPVLETTTCVWIDLLDPAAIGKLPWQTGCVSFT